jgi:iron complex transport system substrate-binding protein
VDIEQVMNWAPDYVLLSPDAGFYLDVFSDKTWAQVPAVRSGRVYEVPAKPYEWCNKPPSVQTVLGVLWMGNLLAPDIYDFDMAMRAREFFLFFWGYDLSLAEARELMAFSTYRGD